MSYLIQINEEQRRAILIAFNTASDGDAYNDVLIMELLTSLPEEEAKHPGAIHDFRPL